MGRTTGRTAAGFTAALLLTAVTATAQGAGAFLGTLWAGKYSDSGTYSLQASADCSELVVQLIPANGWEIAGYHVDIVSDPGNFPLNRAGNPKIGHFQWRASFPPTAAAQSFSVLPSQVIDPIACGTAVSVAIHAVMVVRDVEGSVVAEETAWGGPYGSGSQGWNPHGFLPDGFFEFPGRSWGFYLSFPWQSPPTPTPTPAGPTPTATPVLPTPTATSTPTPLPPTPTPTPTPIPPTPTPLPPTPTWTPAAPTPTPTPVSPTPTWTPTLPPPTPTWTPTFPPPTPTSA